MQDCHADFLEHVREVLSIFTIAEMPNSSVHDILLVAHEHPGRLFFFMPRCTGSLFLQQLLFYGVVTERILCKSLMLRRPAMVLPTHDVLGPTVFYASGYPRAFRVQYTDATTQWDIDWVIDDLCGGNSVRVTAQLNMHTNPEAREFCYLGSTPPPPVLDLTNVFAPYVVNGDAVRVTPLSPAVELMVVRLRAYEAIKKLTNDVPLGELPATAVDEAISKLLLLRDELQIRNGLHACRSEYTADVLEHVVAAMRTGEPRYVERMRYLHESLVCARNLIDFLKKVPNIAEQLAKIDKELPAVRIRRKREFQRFVLKETDDERRHSGTQQTDTDADAAPVAAVYGQNVR